MGWFDNFKKPVDKNLNKDVSTWIPQRKVMPQEKIVGIVTKKMKVMEK